MESNSVTVKRRSYDSTRRRLQASQTRTEILDAAQRLFLSDGYAQTTVAAIADVAGVSVETIYKTFGGKPGLVRAIQAQALAGAGPVPAYLRSDEMRLSERDPRQVIRNWGTLTTEVAPRVSPILLLIRSAAASDPEMAELHDEVVQERLSRMELNARHLYERGDLRAEISLAEARDVLWTYSSPELYELLVLRQRWPLERYGRVIAEAMIAALLPAAG
jgi:AcrR family transcriptional regulator